MMTKISPEKILEKALNPKTCRVCNTVTCYDDLIKGKPYKGTEFRTTKTICKKCYNKKRELKRKEKPSENRIISNKLRTERYKEKCKNLPKKKVSPIKAKNSRLKRLYGVDLDWFYTKLIEIDFTCWICKNHINEKTGVIDHCHTTGKIRNVICNKCNTALGFFKEKEENMLRAIEYLKIFG